MFKFQFTIQINFRINHFISDRQKYSTILSRLSCLLHTFRVSSFSVFQLVRRTQKQHQEEEDTRFPDEICPKMLPIEAPTSSKASTGGWDIYDPGASSKGCCKGARFFFAGRIFRM
ncbi:unnamed protein product [Larinioides sclopetarius]|uniref:Uncharacterized protein n=1 Tax=Larinioides sclopetarius TaxID=280406 RepID=A0AAV1YP58_9ARAC